MKHLLYKPMFNDPKTKILVNEYHNDYRRHTCNQNQAFCIHGYNILLLHRNFYLCGYLKSKVTCKSQLIL